MTSLRGTQPPFRMEEFFEDGRRLRLALVGELDIAATGMLAERLAQLRTGGYTVKLDLARLDFIDSSGIRELMSELTSSKRDGWRLEIGRELTEQVARVIELVGLGPYIWPDGG